MSPSRGFRAWWLWIPAATLLAMGFEHSLWPVLTQRSLPTGEAEWIWADVEPDAGWVGFFTVHDFWLDSVPQGSTSLLVTADEEYVVFLNGTAVGSGRYESGAGVDAYEVSPILVPGENRLLVELRSTHAVGGLLLRLGNGGRSIAVSDGSWSVLEEYREDVKWPGMDTGERAPVRVWGRPPAGRWGRPAKVVPRPQLRKQLLSRRPLPAQTVRLEAEGPWQPLPAEPQAEPSLGRWATFDFGRQVSGFVNVAVARRGGARGLFWVGTAAPPDPRSSPPAGRLFALVGQGSWTDAVPRRFRYVSVVSLAELAGARAYVLKPNLEAELIDARTAPGGVLGIEPPQLRSPVEDEFWSEFEGLASVGSVEAP